MINAASQKKALKAIPKLVFELIVFLQLHLLHQLFVDMHHQSSMWRPFDSLRRLSTDCGGASKKLKQTHRNFNVVDGRLPN